MLLLDVGCWLLADAATFLHKATGELEGKKHTQKNVAKIRHRNMTVQMNNIGAILARMQRF